MWDCKFTAATFICALLTLRREHYCGEVGGCAGMLTPAPLHRHMSDVELAPLLLDTAPKGAQAPTEGRATFPVVGAGASAGGLEALTQLLRALPADTGMGFVNVQQLAPQRGMQLPGHKTCGATTRDAAPCTPEARASRIPK